MSQTFTHFVENIAKDYSELYSQIEPARKIFSHSSHLPPLVKPENLSKNPQVLIVTPHPDDECLMAGYALRMMEEWGARVSVVPFSFGSKKERQIPRRLELEAAVKVLGFDFVDAEVEMAFEKVKPEVVFSPHARDFHPTHTAAFSTVKNSGWRQKHQPLWVQTDYWQANEKPNLFVPLSVEHVSKIGNALMKHVGEITRNPYHLRLPGWYMDQARRAQEVLPGFGKDAPGEHFIFGQLLQVVDLA